jgi:hypothetical protein
MARHRQTLFQSYGHERSRNDHRLVISTSQYLGTVLE